MRKKRIILHTDFALARTGFGRNAKAILSYLYNTGKYQLLNYACGMPINSPALAQTPWLTQGSVPNDPATNQRMQADPNYARAVSYGAERIDEVVRSFKPDIYVGQQDFWGVDYCIDKTWFKKITSVISTTLDSTPLLASAITAAPKIKNYWMWADFATKEMHRLGHTHVKTLCGALDSKDFFKLEDSKRKELRKKFNIPDNCFVIGAVFRNQLRKLLPNMIKGIVEFKKRNPNVNVKFLIHTHLSEGWPVIDLAKEYGLDSKDIIVTYVCRNCGEYEVKSFDDRATPHETDEQGRPKINKEGKFIDKPIQLQDKDCKFCNAQKSQITTNVGLGVTEEQLNEVYNLMDVFLACFTSGGFEIPCYESKLAELIVLSTNYSCGEDICEQGAYSLPLDHAIYWEHGTNFEKASPYPSSIAKQLDKVYKMTPADKKKWGQKAREWAVSKCSVEVIGKKLEEFFDAAPLLDENDLNNYRAGEEKHWNPNAELSPTHSNEEFIVETYHKVLDATDVTLSHPDVQSWSARMKEGMTKDQLAQTFRNIAAQELQKKQTLNIKDLFIQNGKKNFLIVSPESAGDCLYVSATLKSFRESYPIADWNLHLATKPEFLELFEGNPYIDRALVYQPFMDSELQCIGVGNQKFLDGYCFVTAGAQRFLNYLGNNNINLQLQ